MTRPTVLRCALAALLSLPLLPATAASIAPAVSDQGMVVTAQHLATEVGVDVLRRGGNAVDAAVAVGYALAVVYPAAGNLGGGGFMTVHLADGREAFVDFREKAPMAATPDMYLGPDGNVVKGRSTLGHLAVGVPGTVAGLELARERYGTRPRAELVAPAVRLADRGFVLDAGDARMFEAAGGKLKDDPASRAIFAKDGELPRAGERLAQKDLARTLRRIASHGTDGFYRGPVADALVKSSESGGGLLRAADLTGYRAVERQPVACDYRGYRVVSAPPPSSGGVIVCEILNILEGYPLRDLGYRSAQAVHYQIEAMRHAYVDRNSYLGDPDVVENPVARLLDKAYAARVREAIDPARAAVSSDLRPGVPPHEPANTTHYSIADRFGNAVAVTYTLNEWFGAKVTAAGTGVLLNNEMDDFTAKVGVPNAYGLVQGQANAVGPGKRPLSSMSPTIVSRGGKPVMVLGTPGGSRIITTVVHTLINTIDHDMDIQEAVDAPRFHQQWLPDETSVEPHALSPDTARLLTAMGHKLGKPHEANHVAAVLIGPGPRLSAPAGPVRFHGANDPRRRTGLAKGP